MSANPDAQRAVHEALKGYLSEDELPTAWTLTVAVHRADGKVDLLHRAGGGLDGSDSPPCWSALGMLEASADLARCQLRRSSSDDVDGG